MAGKQEYMTFNNKRYKRFGGYIKKSDVMYDAKRYKNRGYLYRIVKTNDKYHPYALYLNASNAGGRR